MLLLLTGWPTNSKSVLGTDSVHHSTTKKKEKKQTVRVGVVLVLLADHECERKVRVFATLRRLLVLGLFTGTLPNVIPPMHHLGFPLGA